jgi:hypothetical protein
MNTPIIQESLVTDTVNVFYIYDLSPPAEELLVSFNEWSPIYKMSLSLKDYKKYFDLLKESLRMKTPVKITRHNTDSLYIIKVKAAGRRKK